MSICLIIDRYSKNVESKSEVQVNGKECALSPNLRRLECSGNGIIFPADLSGTADTNPAPAGGSRSESCTVCRTSDTAGRFVRAWDSAACAAIHTGNLWETGGAGSTTSELLALPHPKNGGTSLRCCADWRGCRGVGTEHFRLGEAGRAPLYVGGKSAAAKQPESGKMLFDDLDGERGICQTAGNRAAHAV